MEGRCSHWAGWCWGRHRICHPSTLDKVDIIVITSTVTPILVVVVVKLTPDGKRAIFIVQSHVSVTMMRGQLVFVILKLVRIIVWF